MNDIAGRAEQIFIVGKGLSKEGTKLLGEQLAGMTIGDLEAMLETNKVDPFLVQQIVKDFIELAKAIVCSLYGNYIKVFVLTLNFQNLYILTLKVPITTAVDDIHKYFFIIFQRK